MVTSFTKENCERLHPPFSNGFRARAFGVLLAAFCFTSGPAISCAFDMVKPEKTTIDWIVDSEVLVLARPSDENPFAFDVIRVLAGVDDGPPINQLVDSSSRRILAARPADAVLFAYSFDQGWRRVAYVDESFRGLLQTALDHRLAWQNSIPQSRLNFITALQGSSVAAHKTVVIGELDKVPYAVLRTLDIRISDEELLKELWSRTGYPYQAIRALLLGLSGTPAARAEIHDYINRVTDWGWANNLGAFAAAYIELEGASGVEHLANTMLLAPNQPLNKLEQIVMAMSVHHGIGDQQIKTSIQESINALVIQRPEAGVIVARQFSLRSDWSQSTALEPLVRERSVALGDLLTISVYMARAREVGVKATGGEYE
ncbi:hypothetical protein C1J03_09830 [Sulfitobacter sp. SK012]|uniref:hypothetical protein n=1 Tax=Sulfitobacter sp. SK012 TaxID=1389005 RepID=UPI000E0BF839|nr:hypothetical protein [Sulfitobacter sp. SK012]AXI46299.1 hypothetical protein C1J03_09830 [Sulfitobacter sp. SK012]